MPHTRFNTHSMAIPTFIHDCSDVSRIKVSVTRALLPDPVSASKMPFGCNDKTIAENGYSQRVTCNSLCLQVLTTNVICVLTGHFVP
jgi:hypothetical protein